ncbi:hypothetical protein [Microbacterium sp.]|uniref:hypothetical protein n=1 Tax=Microbacterium sp. TaxID=51671 RepID=UPI0028122732|nr:hypothetical protein [Microbacterium sp.]
MRPSRRIPLLRGFAAASIATFVALASHVWVSGVMPGPLGLLVPWMLSLMICTLLAGRRLSIVRLSASVVVSQLLFHALFVLGSISPKGGFAPHDHAAMVLSFDGAPVPLPGDAGMWGAHAFAAVVTIAALHRGELLIQALLTAASELRAWLGRVARLPTPVLAVGRESSRWIVVLAPVRQDPVLSGLRRRGPPLRLI